MTTILSISLSRRFLSALGALAMLLAGFALVRHDPASFGLYPCGGRWMTVSQIAAYRHISLETLAEIRIARGLTVPEVCVIPQDKLERAIFRAETPKPDHPGEAIALRNLQMQDENGYIPPDGFEKANDHIEAMSSVPQLEGYAAGIASASWTWIGPGNIGGRVRSIVIHPDDPNTMWAGSVSGGIWKTVDAGASWQILDDFMANMAVSTLAIDPANPNTLYAGTGEGFYNGDGLRGAGVFKTADGGMTWSQLASTANSSWYYVNRLAIHPSNPLVLLAATGSGIYRSTDGGSSWTLRAASYRYYDINFSPDGARAIASAGYGLALYSSDAGETWTPATFTGLGALGWLGRVEVAFAPSDASIVYASVSNNNGEVWKSTDYGQTYFLVNTGNYFLGTQGWYDNIIWVDPTHADNLMVGGIDLYRSTDGGLTLTKVSQWWSPPAVSPHADQHVIVEHPGFDGETNKTLLFGNDGGVYRADDYSTVALTSGWTELNNNLGITQFYGGAGSPVNGILVGGTQDNGTLLYTPDNGAEGWTSEFGGDGGWSAIDPMDPNYIYGEYIYGQVHRSSDGGSLAEYIWGIYNNGAVSGYKSPPYLITEAKEKKGNFIAPLILDPNDSNRLYVGLESLWRTNDVKTPGGLSSPTGPSWYTVKPAAADNPISAIAVLKGNPDVVWVGHNNGDVYKTTNGTSATPAWIKMDDGATPLPNRYVTRISLHPSNPGTAYVTFGGFSTDNVWFTTDHGASWTDRTGSGLTGLPEVPVRSLALHPDFPAWIYAGTEVGVFTSEDAGATWTLPHDGPTNTSVDELFWVNYTLVAATHGRGMYKIAVISPSTLPLPEMNVKGNNRSIPAGDITPSTADHTDFGPVDVASGGMSRTFLIQNTGEDYLDLSGTPAILISGTHAADFSVTLNPSTSIDPNSSTDFTVHFAPRGLGLRTATIFIDNDDPDENPYTFRIQGTATGCFPAVTVQNNLNIGIGSLRNALADVCAGGTVSFSNSLAGQTVTLTSPLTISKNVTVDGSSLAPKVTISGNRAVRVFTVNSGVTTTFNSLIITNGKSAAGGGVYNNGILNINNSVLSNNSGAGGAIQNYNGNLTVTNTLFSNNNTTGGASGNGGAIYILAFDPRSTTIKDSTFTGNSAVYGGAIANHGATLNVSNSTFYANNASYGGGIMNSSGALTSINNTLSGNQASVDGGGIFNQAVMNISNTILANSTGMDCRNAGTIAISKNNLVEDDACGLVNGVNGNIVGIDPHLDALASNGGPTQTIALLSDSPAFNAGEDATCAASPVNSVDQRGMARPQGSRCDIGSYEAEVITVTATDKTITYGDPDPQFDFTLEPPGASLSSEPLCAVSGAHTNAGSYSITCAGGIPVDARYLIEYVPGTLTIGKADPPVTLSISNSPVSYNGSSRSAVVTSSGMPGSVVDIRYDGSSSAPVNVGTYAVTAGFLPADNTNYNSLADLPAGDFVIEKGTASLTVTNSPVVYNGSPQPASVSSSVPGVVSNLLYNGSSTVPTQAGMYVITADFTPGDTQNYNSLSATRVGDFTITAATPAVTLRVTNSYVLYNGSPQSATVRISSGPVPGVIGNIRYNGSAIAPVAAGAYAITVDFIPTDSANYHTLAGVAAGNFVIRRERAKNGGFNSYSGASAIPASWAKNATFAASDGKSTRVKKEGTASVQITGNGKMKTLTQTLLLSGKVGDRVDFSFWARGSSIPTAGICQAQVLLYNGAVLKQTRTIKCSTGTYTVFKKKSISFSASSAFTKVVIKISYSKASGTVWFDAVSLLK